MKRRTLASFFSNSPNTETNLACDPMGLMEFLRDYGIREFGTVFIYVPTPTRSGDRAALAWLTILSAKGIIGSRVWHKKADQVDSFIKQSHPHLMEHAATFEIYCLNQEKLSVFVNQLTA